MGFRDIPAYFKTSDREFADNRQRWSLGSDVTRPAGEGSRLVKESVSCENSSRLPIVNFGNLQSHDSKRDCWIVD